MDSVHLFSQKSMRFFMTTRSSITVIMTLQALPVAAQVPASAGLSALNIGTIALCLVLGGLLSWCYKTKRGKKNVDSQQADKLDTLEKEVVYKEKALQNTTLELLKSNLAFGKLLDELEEFTGTMGAERKRKARSLLLGYRNRQQNKSWAEFNLQFKNANAEFYTQLKRVNNTLTESELRIAAMHASGLSNKEISSITGQSLGSVHTLKSRLRKKMSAMNDEELLARLNKHASN